MTKNTASSLINFNRIIYYKKNFYYSDSIVNKDDIDKAKLITIYGHIYPSVDATERVIAKKFDLGDSQQRFRSLFTRNVFTDYLEIDPNNNNETEHFNKGKSFTDINNQTFDNKSIGINANNGNINNVNAVYLSAKLIGSNNDANINTINFTGRITDEPPFGTIYAVNDAFYFVKDRPLRQQPSTNVIDTDSVGNNICMAKLDEDYLTLRSGIKTYGDVFIGTDDHRKTTTINGNFKLYSSNTDNDGTTKNFLTIGTGINARVDDTITFRGTITTLSTNEGDDKNIRNWIELSQNDDASINQNGTKINNNFHIGYRRNNNTNDGEYKFRVLARTGDTEIKGKLNVEGETQFKNTLDVVGDIIMDNTLTNAAESSTLPIGKITLTSILQTIRNNLKHLFNNKADKSNITGGTNTKITYNSQGIITGGAGLVASDIPYLDASQINSGTLATARLGSGTASSSTYLRGDGTWQTPPPSGTKFYYDHINSVETINNRIRTCEVNEVIVSYIEPPTSSNPLDATRVMMEFTNAINNMTFGGSGTYIFMMGDSVYRGSSIRFSTTPLPSLSNGYFTYNGSGKKVLFCFRVF